MPISVTGTLGSINCSGSLLPVLIATIVITRTISAAAVRVSIKHLPTQKNQYGDP
jgi:hypothetical protein